MRAMIRKWPFFTVCQHAAHTKELVAACGENDVISLKNPCSNTWALLHSIAELQSAIVEIQLALIRSPRWGTSKHLRSTAKYGSMVWPVVEKL